MMMEMTHKRLAVLAGCNYPNTPNELHGCINDVLAMRHLILHRFGFKEKDIEVLTDAPGSPNKPTGANIKKALRRMVDQLLPGDLLFFHYSGHGTLIPSVKPGHPFRQDEAIVPCDFNLITDVDFRQLVNRVPKGANFTIISDSCHSGGLIDKEKEQIGPSSILTKTTTTSHAKPKIIPFQRVLHHLASLTNINTSDVATHLLECFGADASLKFRLPLHQMEQPAEDYLVGPTHPDAGILLSGCQTNETSADMSPPAGGGKAYGAFSNAVQIVLKEHGEAGALSNREVVKGARKVLEAHGFEQHPCLYCSDENAQAAFLVGG